MNTVREVLEIVKTDWKGALKFATAGGIGFSLWFMIGALFGEHMRNVQRLIPCGMECYPDVETSYWMLDGLTFGVAGLLGGLSLGIASNNRRKLLVLASAGFVAFLLNFFIGYLFFTGGMVLITPLLSGALVGGLFPWGQINRKYTVGVWSLSLFLFWIGLLWLGPSIYPRSNPLSYFQITLNFFAIGGFLGFGLFVAEKISNRTSKRIKSGRVTR